MVLGIMAMVARICGLRSLGGRFNDLLLTPTANLGSNGGTQPPDMRRKGGHGPTLADQVEWELRFA